MLVRRPVTQPYDWASLLTFFQTRAIAGVEHVENGRYRRALRIERGDRRLLGWLDVGCSQNGRTLEAVVSPSLDEAVDEVVTLLDRAFDLTADPHEIARALGPLCTRPGLRVPGAFDGFEIAVRAVLGQQITVKAAITLAGRFAQRFGTPLETPFPKVMHAFPSPAELIGVAPDRIAELGIIRTRTDAILSLASLLHAGELALHPGADREATIGTLRSIRGIGEWTAHYIAMRALRDPDVFLHTDYGVMKALNERRPKAVLALAEAWRPWRAYAVLQLWHTL